MELICTNSKHDSGMKFTSPEFFIPFRTQLVNRPVFPFATLETTKKKQTNKLEPKCVPQLFLRSLLGTRQSAVGQFFSLSLVTVPEVFMKVKSAKFSSCFFFFFKVTNANDKEPIRTKNSFVLGCLSNASWWASGLTLFLKRKTKIY